MARTYLFFTLCGIKPEAIRFRQHLANEMAHYSQDCWDAEVETSYGWIEIVGHADRSCYDLTRHANKTKTDLKAAKILKEPIKATFINVKAVNQVIGKTFKKDAKMV